MSNPVRLAFADDDGNAYEHPALLAAVRSADDTVAARPEALCPLPDVGVTLSALPGRLPVGIDPDTGERVVLEEVEVEGRTIRPVALSALFPPGYTRTYLPASERRRKAPTLPLFGYTAVGFAHGELMGAAVRTDARTHWDPQHYNTDDLTERIEARLAEDPSSRILQQVARCAHEYRCFTAQNVFYERHEAAIPLSTVCNAACIGCLSQQDEGGPPPSQWRIAVGPTVDECVRLALRHFERAGRDAIVSWGQGCEGEPLTRYEVIAQACKQIRAKTEAGTLHINTNASMPDAIEACAVAGLDSIRVSLNSARAETYEPYYRPRGYGFHDVRAGIRVAKAAGLFVSLNLLVFPGVNDRREEIDALFELLGSGDVDMVQTRNLCIDPDLYMQTVGASKSPTVGVDVFLERLARELPAIRVGNYNVALSA